MVRSTLLLKKEYLNYLTSQQKKNLIVIFKQNILFDYYFFVWCLRD